jgi:hypothetical protein
MRLNSVSALSSAGSQGLRVLTGPTLLAIDALVVAPVFG